MNTHELKVWPDSFQAAWDEKKPYEVRKDDRNFSVGDQLHLREFAPHEPCRGTHRVWGSGDTEDCGCAPPHGTYTGRTILASVTYKTSGGEWGIPEGLCVLGIKLIEFREIHGMTKFTWSPREEAEQVVAQIDASMQFAPQACCRAMKAARDLLTKAFT